MGEKIFYQIGDGIVYIPIGIFRINGWHSLKRHYNLRSCRRTGPEHFGFAPVM